MSTAIAAAPPTATPSLAPLPSPRGFGPSAPVLSAPPTSEPAAKRQRNNASPPSSGENSVRASSNGKTSPTAARSAAPPTIKVKQEPGASPSMASSRPRPKRLDLSTSASNNRGPNTARPSAPLTSRESAGLQIHDMGLACLSPGFQTHDPAMREQLQRSLDVRDQQRQIIEARQKGTKPGSSHDSDGAQRTQDTTLFGVQTRTPTTSRRKGPPPGLSIAAPSAAQFAHDRVIQSAPLHQTFTGLRPGDQPFSRHSQLGPSGLSQTSHIHHVPATQTNNRLPPIADVFANDRLDVQRSYPPPTHSPANASGPPPVPSPGFHQNPPLSSRAREFRSAEEAVAGLSGGREDLMPKVVHYGGVQPPTPPSPMPPGGPHSHTYPHTTSGAQQPPPLPSYHSTDSPLSSRPDILARTSSMNGRRRGRDEYERDNASPPSSYNNRPGADANKRTTFAVRGDDSHPSLSGSGGGEGRYETGGEGRYESREGAAWPRSEEDEREREGDWRRGMGGREKREEFLRLCERAWDLFHS